MRPTLLLSPASYLYSSITSNVLDFLLDLGNVQQAERPWLSALRVLLRLRLTIAAQQAMRAFAGRSNANQLKAAG